MPDIASTALASASYWTVRVWFGAESEPRIAGTFTSHVKLARFIALHTDRADVREIAVRSFRPES